jgi:DNA-directed RNA polymerase specialized sigma subunit
VRINLLRQGRAAAADLAQQLARTPSDADIAAYLQVSEVELNEAWLASYAFQAYSLDEPLPGQDGVSHGDDIGAARPGLRLWRWGSGSGRQPSS